MDFSLGYTQTPIAYLYNNYAQQYLFFEIVIAGAISLLRKGTFAFSTLELPHYIANIKLAIPFGLKSYPLEMGLLRFTLVLHLYFLYAKMCTNIEYN